MSVSEVKAAIDAAMKQGEEVSSVIDAARQAIEQLQTRLQATLEGSHRTDDIVAPLSAALENMDQANAAVAAVGQAAAGYAAEL